MCWNYYFFLKFNLRDRNKFHLFFFFTVEFFFLSFRHIPAVFPLKKFPLRGNRPCSPSNRKSHRTEAFWVAQSRKLSKPQAASQRGLNSSLYLITTRPPVHVDVNFMREFPKGEFIKNKKKASLESRNFCLKIFI